MPSFLSTSVAAATLVGSALAGFDPSSKSNVAVYWGQNSYGQGSGGLEQKSLATYCQDSDIDVIPMAFLYQLNGVGGQPVINFANIGDSCTTFDGTALLHCPQVAADIKTCQGLGKQVILSVGGATYSEGGFQSADAATAAANKVWETFGPQKSGSSALRPFDDAVVDGFDFDFESTVSNMVPFGQTLRSLMDGDSSKKYLLTAAPQCPYPDAADGEMLAGQVSFDIVMVQFYNNYCGVTSYVDGASTQNNFNFETWDNWAKTTSKNPNVKVMLGVPANTGAGGGYLSADALKPVIAFSKKFDSFGGVMMWDASQAWANSGFVASVKGSLASAKKRALTWMA